MVNYLKFTQYLPIVDGGFTQFRLVLPPPFQAVAMAVGSFAGYSAMRALREASQTWWYLVMFTKMGIDLTLCTLGNVERLGMVREWWHDLPRSLGIYFPRVGMKSRTALWFVLLIYYDIRVVSMNFNHFQKLGYVYILFGLQPPTAISRQGSSDWTWCELVFSFYGCQRA